MVDVALPAGLVSQNGSAPKFLTIDNSQWRRFGHWALIWLVLANAAFIGMWAVGAPPRVIDILAIGAVALLVLKRGASKCGGVSPAMNLDVDDWSPVSSTLAAEYPMICRQFAPDRVPWMLLTWKGDAARQSSVAADKTGAKHGTIG